MCLELKLPNNSPLGKTEHVETYLRNDNHMGVPRNAEHLANTDRFPNTTHEMTMCLKYLEVPLDNPMLINLLPPVTIYDYWGVLIDNVLGV